MPFDYASLKLLSDVIPPDPRNAKLVENIRELDRRMSRAEDYSECEDLLSAIQSEAGSQFEEWLKKKGVQRETSANLSGCLEMFLDFIYAYGHDEVFTLASVPRSAFLEFFEDYLIRKMYASPHEYVDWPPSLKLFYRFLVEKGYLANADPLINMINSLEPGFIALLRRHFE